MKNTFLQEMEKRGYLNQCTDLNKLTQISEKKSISGLPKMNCGNHVYGTSLLIDKKDKELLINNYPESGKYIKKFIGANEFMKGIERYCLWIEDHDYDDAMKIPDIKKRIDETYEFRLNMKDESLQKLATRPHQFRDRRVTSENKYTIIVPQTGSERRKYLPLGIIDSKTAP